MNVIEPAEADLPQSQDLTPPPEALTPPPQALTEPADGTPPIVETPEALEEAINALAAGTGPVAIDAERAGGYRYGNRAYLVQLRREGSGTHLIDPIAFTELAELGNALRDTEWILHAASQDLPCLDEIEMRPAQLFDTELAARLLGKPRVGLAALAESELGLSLAKEHSAADWSTRPLPQAWLRYAALDVELLVELRQILKDELIAAGRWEWAHQEFEYLRLAPTKPARVDPWRRVSGLHRARSPRQLAIVRELWMQRDRLAQSRDTAPGRVLPDKAIAEAALARPANRAAFEALPAFQGRGTKRRIGYWWEAVDRAATMPADELPPVAAPTVDTPPPARAWSERAPEAAARLAAARSAVSAVADELSMPSENILTPELLRRLCWTPLTEVTTTSVRTFLHGHGAREWQLELTVVPLTSALDEAK